MAGEGTSEITGGSYTLIGLLKTCLRKNIGLSTKLKSLERTNLIGNVGFLSVSFLKCEFPNL